MPSAHHALVIGCATIVGACSIAFASDLNGARTIVDRPADGGPSMSLDAAGTLAAASDADAAPAGLPGCSSIRSTWSFCDDFDLGSSLDAEWTENADPGGRVSVAADPFAFSAPKSLQASLTNAPDCTYARLERSFRDLGTTRQEVAFRFRPSRWNNDVGILALGLDSGGAADHCTAIFGLQGDATHFTRFSLNFQQATPEVNDDREVPDLPAADEWNDLDVTTSSSARGVSVDVVLTRADGQAHKTTIAVPQCKLGPSLFVMLGFHCTRGTADARYDDVRLRSN